MQRAIPPAIQDSASAFFIPVLSCPCVILERSEESRILLRLARLVAGEAAPTAWVRVQIPRAIQDSASALLTLPLFCLCVIPTEAEGPRILLRLAHYREVS
jgi:hypothetical protein